MLIIAQTTVNTLVSVPFSAPYSATARLYYVAVLYNQSAQTTAPSLSRTTSTSGGIQTGTFTNSNKLGGYIDTQTSLPASQLLSGLTGAGINIWVALY